MPQQIQTVKEPYREFAVYLFTVSLTGNQELTDQTIAIDADSDFIWTKLCGTSDGDYELRFRLPSGRYISSSRIKKSNLVGSSATWAMPILPPVECPASGKIGVDIKDLSGAANNVQLALIGYRAFPRR